MAAPTQERFEDLEPPIRAIGTDLAARMPVLARSPPRGSSGGCRNC